MCGKVAILFEKHSEIVRGCLLILETLEDNKHTTADPFVSLKMDER